MVGLQISWLLLADVVMQSWLYIRCTSAIAFPSTVFASMLNSHKPSERNGVLQLQHHCAKADRQDWWLSKAPGINSTMRVSDTYVQTRTIANCIITLYNCYFNLVHMIAQCLEASNALKHNKYALNMLQQFVGHRNRGTHILVAKWIFRSLRSFAFRAQQSAIVPIEAVKCSVICLLNVVLIYGSQT